MEKYLEYERDASRSELLIRMVYTPFIGTILFFYFIARQICFSFQWLGILLLGTRNKGLTNVLIGSNEFIIQTIPYIFLLTDKRPGVMPKELKFFINNREYLNFEEDASRLELIIRIFYSIPIGIIAYLFAFITNIVLFLQWFCILFTGGRSEGLNNLIRSFVGYIIQVISYVSLITDERPGILPEGINVSVEMESDEVGTTASGDVIKTSPPLSRHSKDKHIAMGILLMVLLYAAFYVLYVILFISMIGMTGLYR